MASQKEKTLPSKRWTSLEGWDYNGMKERLECALEKLNKTALVQHTESLLGQKFTLSEPFSAGQYWVCFELVGQDSRLVVARVRLPRHPDTLDTVDEASEVRAIECEVETMRFVKDRIPSITIPKVYTYEGPSSKHAVAAGAVYMLLEGFHGNTLQDIEFDMTCLPIDTQEHIITQWTAAQVALASITFPTIGSIYSSSASKIYPESLSTAPADGLDDAGPFPDSLSYLKAIGKARYAKACREDEGLSTKAALLTFLDIVENTTLFREPESGVFPLSHMDMGTQNILVDDDYNFLAIIDWEFAQTAPWQTFHYPMPFPLLDSKAKLEHILQAPDHVAYENVSRHAAARRIYLERMKQAEVEIARQGRPLAVSIADTLDGAASRVYACLERLSGDEHDETLACEMVRLAYRLDFETSRQFFDSIKSKVNA